MKLRITSIGISQTARTVAALYGLLGIIVGVFAFFFALYAPSSRFATTSGFVPAIFALILFPIFYALGAFIFVAIGSWVYNFVAAKTGGVEFHTTPVSADIVEAGLAGASWKNLAQSGGTE